MLFPDYTFYDSLYMHAIDNSNGIGLYTTLTRDCVYSFFFYYTGSTELLAYPCLKIKSRLSRQTGRKLDQALMVTN